MENPLEMINNLWKMKLIFNCINIFKYIIASLPVALLFLLLYEPIKDYIYYHLTDKMVKVLVFIYLFLLVSPSITQSYLDVQINRGVIEIEKELTVSKLWLIKAVDKDTFKKLEKLKTTGVNILL
jgi:hypothetical protein